jgi:hypothetical protein
VARGVRNITGRCKNGQSPTCGESGGNICMKCFRIPPLTALQGLFQHLGLPATHRMTRPCRQAAPAAASPPDTCSCTTPNVHAPWFNGTLAVVAANSQNAGPALKRQQPQQA